MINQDVADQLTRARTQLILDHSFFGTLALRLPLVEDATGTKTLSVDGKRIRYNPEFVETLSGPLTKAAIAHEVMHCVFDHIGRRNDRNPRKWNQAGDYVINLALKDSGFEIGKSWLLNTAFAGMSADEIYNLLPEADDDDGKDPLDECQDGDPNDTEVTATDWKIATIQAANQARAEGKLPASMERFIDDLTATKLDWRAMLRRFITETSRDDYTWARPNRHFIQQGIFLPTLFSESMGEIVIGIDTSGSITQETLNVFGGEVRAIVQSSRPSKVHVVYCDDTVNHVDEFGPNDELVFNLHGGRYTAFKPVFDYVVEKSIKPDCLVYLTDLYGDATFAQPDYPVMWGCISNMTAPWGETIPVES